MFIFKKMQSLKPILLIIAFMGIVFSICKGIENTKKVPNNVHVLKQFAISIVAGLVIGCAIVFMMFYFDRTVKTKEDIETKIGLSVLGTIEGYRG